jgi:hypothetical protein
MLSASNYFDYAVALKKFYERLTPWEKKFKYKTFKRFIYLHTINAEYIDIYFKPGIMSQRLLDEFEENNIEVNIIVNEGVQFDLPHTLDNIIIIPKKFLSTAGLNDIIAHELFHIYFRFFDSNTLRSFRFIRSIVKLDRQPFVSEITNPDVEDYEGLLIGNKVIFKVLLDGGTGYIEKYFTSIYSGSKCLLTRPASSLEKNVYDQQLPFVQNYHSEEIIAEICA